MADFKYMLKYLRKRANLSQKELADKIGISPSAISMYEMGRRTPDFETEEALADFFNVNLDTLRGKSSDSQKEDLPEYDPDNIRLISLYSQLNRKDKNIIIDCMEGLVARYEKQKKTPPKQ